MIRILAGLLVLALARAPAAAGELILDGDFTQGGLVVGQTAPGAEVMLDERPLRVSASGIFVFGFGRDARGPARLSMRFADGREEVRVLEIARRTYAVQRIDGLPPNMVSPSAKELERIRREGRMIAEVRRRDSRLMGFAEGFRWPVIGTITGVYGTGRILNGEPRRPHFGIDIAAPAGAQVHAAAPGSVALAEADLFFTGGTVMIDHGHGMTSVYSHLNGVGVSVGDQVERGDPIGRVGATGRVTGAHLDWRVSWFKQPLDPALLAGPMPAAE